MSVNCVLDTYAKMHSVDALVFGPHLPTAVLARLCFLNHPETIALKKICSMLKMFDPDEIEARSLEHLDLPDLPDISETTEPENTDPHAPYTDISVIRTAIAALRPYLSESKINSLPRKLYEDFLRVPEHHLRRAYSGKNFAKTYAREREYILDHTDK